MTLYSQLNAITKHLFELTVGKDKIDTRVVKQVMEPDATIKACQF